MYDCYKVQGTNGGPIQVAVMVTIIAESCCDIYAVIWFGVQTLSVTKSAIQLKNVTKFSYFNFTHQLLTITIILGSQDRAVI